MATNRSAPPATITPVLPYPDVRAAVSWLGAAFGFEERVRIGAGHRAQLALGDGCIVAVEGPEGASAGSHAADLLKLRVADVDAAFARATEAGAIALGEPTTYPYGERSCVVADLGGHRWELTQTVRDVEPEEWGGVTVAPW